MGGAKKVWQFGAVGSGVLEPCSLEQEPIVASLFLVILVLRPGAPSRVLVPSSKARSP